MKRSLFHALLIACLSAGCPFFISRNYAPAYPERTAEIRHMPLAEQEAEFSSLPFEVQFDVYMVDMVNMHPPGYAFLTPIAQNATDHIPFLEDQLKRQSIRWNRSCVLEIFSEMTRLGVDLRGRQEFVSYLQQMLEKSDPNFIEHKAIIEILAGPKKEAIRPR